MANKWTNGIKDTKNQVLDAFPWLFKRRARRLVWMETVAPIHRGVRGLHDSAESYSVLGIACNTYLNDKSLTWNSVADGKYNMLVDGIEYTHYMPYPVRKYFDISPEDVLKLMGMMVNNKPIAQMKSLIKRI